MKRTNIEIKAHCANPHQIRELLRQEKADFKGIDHQVDTYFKANAGRLKLREGLIENHLIHYHRANQAGPKKSDVLLFETQPGSAIKQLLTAALGILVVVDKNREIYYIKNVKFHIDQVKELGSFVEIEAIDRDGSIGEEQLQEQCQHFMTLFHIADSDLVDRSYSDLLLEKS